MLALGLWPRSASTGAWCFLHVDVLVWLLNLHHLEPSTLFFAYFLLMRVADQVGFGFRRAFYFNHVVCWRVPRLFAVDRG